MTSFTYEPAASNEMKKLNDAYIVLKDGKYHCRAWSRDHAEELCHRLNSAGKERRVHCHLRQMVEDACSGTMPHLQKRIKDVARKAYYLGALDGMNAARDPGVLAQHETERRS